MECVEDLWRILEKKPVFFDESLISCVVLQTLAQNWGEQFPKIKRDFDSFLSPAS